MILTTPTPFPSFRFSPLQHIDLTKSDISILRVEHNKSCHSTLFNSLRINHHRRQDLRRLRGAEVVAGPVVAARGLEPRAARRDHTSRAIVHLVEHGALDDEDGDGRAAVRVGRR